MGEGLDGFVIGSYVSMRGAMGALEGTLSATRETLDKAYEDLSTIETATKRFTSDDAGLRAVIRSMTKELRFSDPTNRLLDKGERDRVYGGAHESAMERKGVSGDAPRFANREGLFAIIEALEGALIKCNPQSIMIGDGDADRGGKAFEYKSAYLAEWDKNQGNAWKKINENLDQFPFGIKKKS